MDRVHETGIIGSLRWWYEAIVRGLGGEACDPTDNQSCPDKDGKRCAACELFGCTSWQRKFKLLVLDENKSIFRVKPDQQNGLAEGTQMIWKFVELRPICDEEKWLLYQAIRIASKYGAIGGRTPRKPQGNKKVGGDYGLVTIEEKRNLPQITRGKVQDYLMGPDLRHFRQSERWPNLQNFFFVTGQYLRRKKLNELLGLSEDGKQKTSNGPVEKALRGDRGVSKKVFSFETSPGRMWGYLPNSQLRDDAIKRVKELGIVPHNIRTGEDLINEL